MRYNNSTDKFMNKKGIEKQETMRIFKNTQFSRFAEKEDISNEELKAVVAQLESGQIDADLGGGVYKQRIARQGEGKAGGYRVIVFFKNGDRSFFVFGFAKADMDNITQKQLKKMKETAKDLFLLTLNQLDELVNNGSFKELQVNLWKKNISMKYQWYVIKLRKLYMIQEPQMKRE